METSERVRYNSSEQINHQIDNDIHESIKYYYYHRDEIEKRIAELDKEWDIERVIELNAAVIALAGLALGASLDKKWLILPMVAGLCLAQHATLGWCPPLPFLRAMKIRTRQEIDREKYGLKALIGDFDIPKRSREIWEAVK